MSTIHANAQICNPAPAFDGTVLSEISSAVASARRTATDLMSAFRHRLELDRIDRFSDHRLHDIGFERDWDGSLIRRQA